MGNFKISIESLSRFIRHSVYRKFVLYFVHAPDPLLRNWELLVLPPRLVVSQDGSAIRESDRALGWDRTPPSSWTPGACLASRADCGFDPASGGDPYVGGVSRLSIIMTYLILLLFMLAIFFFWQSNRQQKAAGLPGGRVIYTDTDGWGKVEKPLYYAALGLAGKPDYLIERNGQIIPVEVKSGRAPEAPYDSHIFQLASYCLLVEKTYKKRPPYGIIHYENRDFAVDYTRELESALIELLADMRIDEAKRNVPRSHEQASRCKGCGYRNVCNQRLA